MNDTTAEILTQLQSDAAWYAKEQKKEQIVLNIIGAIVFVPMFATLCYVAGKAWHLF